MNLLLGHGNETQAVMVMGCLGAGEAQSEAQATSDSHPTCMHVPMHEASVVAARVLGTSGFSSLGGRPAARIQCAGVMAGHGPPPARHGPPPAAWAGGAGRGFLPPARQGQPPAATWQQAGTGRAG